MTVLRFVAVAILRYLIRSLLAVGPLMSRRSCDLYTPSQAAYARVSLLLTKVVPLFSLSVWFLRRIPIIAMETRSARITLLKSVSYNPDWSTVGIPHLCYNRCQYSASVLKGLRNQLLIFYGISLNATPHFRILLNATSHFNVITICDFWVF
jgi:hypothetical protein